ncbi:MAG: amidoligase family protein [Armatimonadetes bacterium]|nr:amidoligase family protein [Armatimonadota bacterium]
MAAIKFTKARNRAWEQYQEKLRQNKPLEKMIRKKSIDKNAKQEMKQELRDRQAMAEKEYHEAIAQIEKHEKQLTPQVKQRDKEETERRKRIVQSCLQRISAWSGRGGYGELTAADCVRELGEFCCQTTHPAMQSYIDAQNILDDAQEKGIIEAPGFWGYRNGGYEAVNLDIYAAAPSVCIVQERVTQCPKRDYYSNTKKTYYLIGYTDEGRSNIIHEILSGQFVHAAIARDNAPAAPILAALKRMIAESRNDLPVDFWCREAEREPRPTWAMVKEKIRERREAPKLDGVYDIVAIRDQMTFGLEIEGAEVSDAAPCYRVHSEHCGEEAVSDIFTFAKWARAGRTQTQRIIQYSQPATNAGIHIHVGIMNLFNRPTEIRKTLLRLVTVWDAIEDDIAEIANRNRERIRFCNKWNSAYVVDIYDDLANNRCTKKNIKSVDKTANKYKTLNLKALKEHGTVEFRLWNSTKNWDYVENAVMISTGVVAYAIATRDNKEDIYNYETTYDDFETFLEKWKSLVNNL